jgi:hypothetical protein
LPGAVSSPMASALTNLSAIGPVLRTIEDPVDNIPSQLLMPDVQRSYGGVLGDWNPEDDLHRSGGGGRYTLRDYKLNLN